MRLMIVRNRFIPPLLNSIIVIGCNKRSFVRSFHLSHRIGVVGRSQSSIQTGGGGVRCIQHHHRIVPRQSYSALCASAPDSGSNSNEPLQQPKFQAGSQVQIEVQSFGPLGASVHVIAPSHNVEDVIEETAPPLAVGLISQQEIHYFRSSRENVDVVRGEVLPAYVEEVRQSDGKLRIGLRPFGGRAKASVLSELILERLEQSNGKIGVGDKSKPREIEAEFPGTSKAAFKKAVSALYKQRKVVPGSFSIRINDGWSSK